MEVERSEIRVVDARGVETFIVAVQRFREYRSFTGTSRAGGLIELFDEHGRTVTPIGDDEFEVVVTGERFRRL